MPSEAAWKQGRIGVGRKFKRGGWKRGQNTNLSRALTKNARILVLTYLVYIVKVGFHTLNGDIFVGLRRLGFEYFREGSLTFLANKTVFYRNELALDDM